MNSILIVVLLGCSCMVASGSVISDLETTNAINKKLCEPGTHDDATAAEFFACYDNVPGKKQYIECQVQVYGNPMNTEAHIDTVCTANKFPAYATCLLAKFALHLVNPLQAIKQLNACQGPVMGIPV